MNDEVLDRIAELAPDERAAYRAGYLAKMASNGYTPSDADNLLAGRPMAKRAAGGILTLLGLSKLFDNGVSKLPAAAAGLAVGLPIALGGVAGWGVANLRNPGEEDIEILENNALADEYRHQTNVLKGELARMNRRSGGKRRRSIGL
jgi:hypothetical protein